MDDAEAGLYGPTGVRNKRGRNAKDKHDAPMLVSSTVLCLQKQWAWGHCSPQECQRVAAMVLHDLTQFEAAGPGAGFPDLTNMATMGTSGKYPQHMHKGMLTTMPHTPLPHPEPLTLPATDRDSGDSVPLLHFIIYPHLLLHALYNSMPGVFVQSNCPRYQNLECCLGCSGRHPTI